MNSESNKKQAVRLETVSANHDGQRVDNFLAHCLKGVPKNAIYRMIRTGQVRINGGRCKPDRRVIAGDAVRIPPVRVTDGEPVALSPAIIAQVRAATLYHDDDFLVVNKPAGMTVHSGSGLPWGLIDAVRQARPEDFFELVHRLDRETSGCLVLARNGQALRHLSGLFRDGTVRKKYLCLMDGVLNEDRVTVDEAIRKVSLGGESIMEVHADGKPAVTHFKRLQTLPGSTYAEVELVTGRTHQIRVHAAHLGLPLAGDDRYGSAESVRKWKKIGLHRLFLHAHQLSFSGPGNEILTFDAPLPDALREVLDSLGA